MAAPQAKTEVQSQAAFDLLEKSTAISQKSKEQKRSGILGRVEDLKLDLKFQSGAGEKMAAEPELSPAVNENTCAYERSQLPMSAAPLLRDRPGESYPQLSGVPVRTLKANWTLPVESARQWRVRSVPHRMARRQALYPGMLIAAAVPAGGCPCNVP